MLAALVKLLKSLVPRRGGAAWYALLALVAVCAVFLVVDLATRRRSRRGGRWQREYLDGGDGEFCTARGGTWDGANSICSVTKSGCEGKGGVWNNGCNFTQAYCTNSGGTIDAGMCTIGLSGNTCKRYGGTYDKAARRCTLSATAAPITSTKLGPEAPADAIQVVDGCSYTPRVAVAGARGGKGCPRNLPVFVGDKFVSALVTKGQGARECADNSKCREIARRLTR